MAVQSLTQADFESRDANIRRNVNISITHDGELADGPAQSRPGLHPDSRAPVKLARPQDLATGRFYRYQSSNGFYAHQNDADAGHPVGCFGLTSHIQEAIKCSLRVLRTATEPIAV